MASRGAPTTGSTSLRLSPGLAGLAVCAVTGSVVIALTALSNKTGNAYVFTNTVTVAVGPILGFLLGFLLVERKYGAVNRQCKSTSAFSELDTREASFILFCAALNTAYVVMYYFALQSFVGEEQSPIWHVRWGVAAMTAVTLGFLCYFSVGYSSYVKLTKVLEKGLEKKVRRQDIRVFSDAVFRGEQWYDPPGNIFVSVGITATFLGLAVGLVTLDIGGLFGSQGDVTNSIQATTNGQSPNAPTSDEVKASLRSFVACMGLALGVSMLGIMIAIAAQWLRGYGASESTEELLGRAANASAEPTPTGAAAAAATGQ